MHVHLVFVTKCRRKVFTKVILQDLREIFSTICQDFEAKLIEFEGEEDHVHMLVEYPPKIAISRLVNSLKGVSSRLIQKKNYPSIKKALWGDHLWSPSYFAGSCGGALLGKKTTSALLLNKILEQESNSSIYYLKSIRKLTSSPLLFP